MRSLSRSEIDGMFELLPAREQDALWHRQRWLNDARPKQLPNYAKDWFIWIALAGRGFGKTRTGAEDIWWKAYTKPGTRWAVVAPTVGDLRRTIFEGDSGLKNTVPHSILREGSWDKAYNRSLSELFFANGSKIEGYSADAPERLRGPQFHGAWADELAAWTDFDAWDMLMFATRLGTDTRILATTTPKPRKLIRDLAKRAIASDGVAMVRGTTYENKDHLSPGFLREIAGRYEGTTLGRQELYAEILDDIEGALWTHSMVDGNRVKETPDLVRIVVAIDPAATNVAGSNETGLVVCGIDGDDHYYVLADETMSGHPSEWARRALDLYTTWRADRIVGEVNNGGDMIEALLQAVAKDGEDFAYRKVHATRGKVVRAEPISAIYEQNRAHHVGQFPDLEEQMFLITRDFDPKVAGFSPDRVDAMVWAMTELSEGSAIPLAAAMPVSEGGSYWRDNY